MPSTITSTLNTIGCPPSFTEQNGRCYRAVPFLSQLVSPLDRDVCKSMTWNNSVTLSTSTSLTALTFLDYFTRDGLPRW